MGVATQAHAADQRRIDLEVLVLTDGSVTVDALVDALAREGVPYTSVDLSATDRPTINASFLSDSVSGMPRGKYQGVILPAEQTSLLALEELDAIDAYQVAFGIRSVSAYNWANPGIGLQYADYSGPVDGATGNLTTYAKQNGWTYLNGVVPFEDNDPNVDETWAYLAQPDANLPSGSRFDPVLTESTSGHKGVLAGVLTKGAEQDLVLTFAYNKYQRQFQTISHGLVEWLTKGVHLGITRNYLSVHVDDVLSPDARWNTAANCTPEEDCPADPSYDTPEILMTPADVTTTTAWEATNDFVLDLVYNAAPAAERAATGDSALNSALLAARSSFRWINHTYTHEYLGCIKDTNQIPWACQRDASGSIEWTSKATIENEISQNLSWATKNGIKVTKSELVTGEHSGLASLPQAATDNPNLAPAIASRGIKVIASDASREFDSRLIGAARTLPRYPMNVFFSAGTEAEMTDLYNWIYTRLEDGGSGICESNPLATCIAPLDVSTGYRDYIVPREVQVTLRHMMSNDPRPHYAHQSNLAEDRILMPVIEQALADYRTVYAANAAVVNPTMTQASAELARQSNWTANSKVARGYIVGSKVTITTTRSTEVPVTVPIGTKRGTSTFGDSYAGSQSRWVSVGTSLVLTLPAAVASVQTEVAPMTLSGPEQVTKRLTTPSATRSGSTTPTDATSLESLAVTR